MTNSIAPDHAARTKIITDLDTNFLVEAGAGSGKTTSMVSRMVALIKEGKCRIYEVAAVTFTRKAAAELRERFQNKLEEAIDQESDHVIRNRLLQALEDLDKSFMGTIHSFCARLLRERPVEAGLNPGFIELQELDECLLKEKAWDEYINISQTCQPHVMQEFVKLDVSPGDLKDLFHTLATYPDVEIVHAPTTKPDITLVRERLREFLRLAAPRIPVKMPVKGWDKLQEVLRRALRYTRIFDLQDERVVFRILALLERPQTIIQNRWVTADVAKEMLSDYELFRQQVAEPVLRAWREYRHYPLMQFAMNAVKYYDEARLRTGKLNFEDLLMKTAELLRENAEVRAYFQCRFKRILVDEYQDTDPIQAEIMFLLTGENTAEKDWRKLKPRQGALFVVGDPKQSIYRFRRADIATYKLVQELIEKHGGEILTLTANFRSVHPIGEWVNPVIDRFLPDCSNEYQAALTRMDTMSPCVGVSHAGVRSISIGKKDGNSRLEIVAEDAERIACWIRWALDGNVQLEAGIVPTPKDFMILLRYKDSMNIYARALERYGIAYEIAGGGALAASQELKELLKLLQALIDPDNPVKLAAALRGLFFGISDHLLYQFKQHGGVFHYRVPLPDTLPPDINRVFERAWTMLQTYSDWINTLSPTVAFEKIVSDTGIIPLALAGNMGKSQCGYIFYVQEYLRAAERAEILSFSKLAEYFATLMEQGAEDELNVEGEVNNVVRLMNLHKAKGLEANVIFMAHPAKRTEWKPDRHITRKNGKPQGYFVVTRTKNYSTDILAQPLGWDEFAKEERKYAAAEEYRLLYVAITRPKCLLVVSRYPDKPDKSAWRDLENALEDQEELENPEVHYTPSLLVMPDVAASLSKGVMDEMAGNINSLLKPTFRVAAVTAVAKPDGERPVGYDTGKGLSWGRVIHKVLAACAQHSSLNLDVFITNALVEEERSVEEAGEVLDVVKKVMASTIWQRAMAAQQRLIEVPFGLTVKNSELAAVTSNEADEDVVLTGAIDLIFKEEDGWVLVDYKTDRFEGWAERRKLEEYYQPQIDLYARFWERVSGEQVKDSNLLFLCELE